MSKIEIVVRRGPEAERVTTAFYRFLELHSPTAADLASVQTEILGELEKRVVHLWSDEAVREFEKFLSRFRLEPPRGLPPAFGSAA